MWDKVKAFFARVLGYVQGFMEPLAREIAANGGKLLLSIALEAVMEAEKKGGTGREKFDAARELAETRLKAQGLPIVINALNGAIEAAVARIKAGG